MGVGKGEEVGVGKGRHKVRCRGGGRGMWECGAREGGGGGRE